MPPLPPLKSRRRPTPAPSPKPSPLAAFAESFFRTLLPRARLDELWERGGPKPRGQAPKLAGAELILALVYHALHASGTLSRKVFELFGISISDSALSQRRASAGVEIFLQIARASLKPLADPKRHPGAFYKGWRLLGIDGSQASVTNTPQCLAHWTKAKSRRFRAAFAKLPFVWLIELGTHAPVGVSVGLASESEWTLAQRLLPAIGTGSLVLLDRLYGVGAYCQVLLQKAHEQGFELLVRARSNLKVKRLQQLSDGSAWVEVRVSDGQKGCRRIQVREIWGRVRRGGKAWSQVRLWTSLLDPKKYPASELLALYAQRWEIELSTRELKMDLNQGQILRSHTPESAAQEILVLVLAMALLSQTRLAAAENGELPTLRISFRYMLTQVRSLWVLVAAAADELTSGQLERIVARVLQRIAEYPLPKRRARTCPRAVRQPIGKWPRLIHNSQEIGPCQYQILST